MECSCASTESRPLTRSTPTSKRASVPLDRSTVIIRKSPAEIEAIARAGRIVRGCLDMLCERARPGVSTRELDRLAEEYIRGHGGVPTFKGYRGFPGSICTSPNDMVVHGIPGATKLEDGDILGVDVGVTMDGYI